MENIGISGGGHIAVASSAEVETARTELAATGKIRVGVVFAPALLHVLCCQG